MQSCVHSCQVRARLAVSTWDKHDYGEPVTVPCRWQPTRQLVVDAEGRSVLALAGVLLPPEAAIGPDDILVWPPSGREHLVVKVARGQSLQGKVLYHKARY